MSTNERDLIVGGQAVIEGVMMRTPSAYAIAVRKADGTIVNTSARLPKLSATSSGVTDLEPERPHREVHAAGCGQCV